MKKLNKNEIIEYLKTRNKDEISHLFKLADETRKKYVGDDVHIRGLIEFSNYCSKDCHYCGIRKSNKKVERYLLSLDDIYNCAQSANAMAYKTIVLQSGESMVHRVEDFAKLVEKIKNNFNLAITLSLGELKYDEYKMLKDAGADRYLMRFETSDKQLFEKLRPEGNYNKRFEILSWLKKLGYQLGSGIMIGLPEQSMQSIADDILLFDKLELDMIGNGPFIANPNTPLAGSLGGDLTAALKLVALTRIVTLNAHIPATTALGSIDNQGRQKALKCGANVIMPNVTPREYRKNYQLYPGKICINENPSDCKNCIRAMVELLGRKIALSHGHSLKKFFLNS